MTKSSFVVLEKEGASLDCIPSLKQVVSEEFAADAIYTHLCKLRINGQVWKYFLRIEIKNRKDGIGDACIWIDVYLQ